MAALHQAVGCGRPPRRPVTDRTTVATTGRFATREQILALAHLIKCRDADDILISHRGEGLQFMLTREGRDQIVLTGYVTPDGRVRTNAEVIL